MLAFPFHNVRALLHDLLRLREDELDVAWIRHVRVDLREKNDRCQHTFTHIPPLPPRFPEKKSIQGGIKTYPSMRAIGPTSLFRRLVHLDVLDDQVARVEALGVGVGLGVLEQAEEELGGFDGPAGFGDAELFAYSHRHVSAFKKFSLCRLLPLPLPLPLSPNFLFFKRKCNGYVREGAMAESAG